MIIIFITWLKHVISFSIARARWDVTRVGFFFRVIIFNCFFYLDYGLSRSVKLTFINLLEYLEYVMWS